MHFCTETSEGGLNFKWPLQHINFTVLRPYYMYILSVTDSRAQKKALFLEQWGLFFCFLENVGEEIWRSKIEMISGLRHVLYLDYINILKSYLLLNS